MKNLLFATVKSVCKGRTVAGNQKALHFKNSRVHVPKHEAIKSLQTHCAHMTECMQNNAIRTYVKTRDSIFCLIKLF